MDLEPIEKPMTDNDDGLEIVDRTIIQTVLVIILLLVVEVVVVVHLIVILLFVCLL